METPDGGVTYTSILEATKKTGRRRTITPLHIQLLLHYHCNCEPYSKDNYEHAHSRSVIEFMGHLVVNWGLLVKDASAESGYRTTEKGAAYVDMLCSVPLPVCKWVAPDTDQR